MREDAKLAQDSGVSLAHTMLTVHAGRLERDIAIVLAEKRDRVDNSKLAALQEERDKYADWAAINARQADVARDLLAKARPYLDCHIHGLDGDELEEVLALADAIDKEIPRG